MGDIESGYCETDCEAETEGTEESHLSRYPFSKQLECLVGLRWNSRMVVFGKIVGFEDKGNWYRSEKKLGNKKESFPGL